MTKFESKSTKIKNSSFLIFLEDKTSAQLKDLQSSTTYEIQLEVYKERDHQTNKCMILFF